MKIEISKNGKNGAVAKNEQGEVIARRRAAWIGASFSQAADDLAQDLLGKHDNISISIQGVAMFEQVGGKLVWSALDAGLSA